jgi:hypothetical protein
MHRRLLLEQYWLKFTGKFKKQKTDSKKDHTQNPESAGMDIRQPGLFAIVDLYPHTSACCAKFCP